MADLCIGMVLSAAQPINQEAIERILGQQGIDLELILLGADDDFPPPLDSRVRLLQRSRPPTQIELLQLLATESTAPLLLCLQPNQHLLPNTLSEIVSNMQADAGIEMTYALQFRADAAGQVSRAAYHREWEQAQKLQVFDAASVHSFLALEFLFDNPRVYRRQALSTKVFCWVRHHTMYGFIWSVHRLLKTRLKPEPVCISKGTLPARPGQDFDTRCYLGKVRALLLHRGRLQTRFGVSEVLLGALWYFCLNSRPAMAWSRSRQAIRLWRVRTGFADRFYWFFVRLFNPWPAPNLPASRDAVAKPSKKIGYYIWQYPVRSQTFVQREVAALLKAGQDLIVITETEPEHEFISELKGLLEGSVIRHRADKKVNHPSLAWKFFRRAPLRYFRLRLFVLGSHYHPKKNRRFDKELFRTALRLANLVENRGINHLHSPWADNCAFVALVASRLIGIPFSLQARAHDIHRRDYQFGLREKFLGANFIITNTRYNVGEIQSIIGVRNAGKIKHIYNGLNIRQFQPKREQNRDDHEIRLLCVARLIDQKGLIYLLQACRRLLDTGVKLRCDIVGGFEDIFINYYIRLKRLHQALGLENAVRFTGSLPFEQVLSYYQQADVFVLPCVIADDGSRDIIPNAVLEAMAMQLPVVATTVTGLPEMVDHGQSGFLVPPHDVDALVSAIETLVQSPSLRAEFGLAARKKVEQQFDSDINVARYQELFGKTPKSAVSCS